MMDLPLARFSVLDLTLHRAGPACVRQLADWGAQVLKIEAPGGAKGDAIGADRTGCDYQNLHRNKRSRTLNLKSEEGRRIFLRLAERADVLLRQRRQPCPDSRR
jgi:crotonobetainyl-CoA:carnitine CoA-transferase CaiB-like acyl-CoA transferase